MLTTQTTSAGLTWRSAAMAGRAILAIAVSSEAIASAVKIAATAQRLSSGGKPSMGGFSAASAVILAGSPRQGAVAPYAACTTDTARATATPLHDAYAKGRRRLKSAAPFPRGDFRMAFRARRNRLGFAHRDRNSIKRRSPARENALNE